MWGHYDENLNRNAFLQHILSKHHHLLVEHRDKSPIICVPRTQSITHENYPEELILNHILVPANNSYETLSKKGVEIADRSVHDVPILFEETFYVRSEKYLVLCLERPLFTVKQHKATPLGEIVLDTSRDCVEYLKSESILAEINKICRGFVDESRHTFWYQSLQSQREIVGVLYSKCLQVALKHPSGDIDRVKISVETVMQRCLGKFLVSSINSITSHEDSELNRIITSNTSQLEPLDLSKLNRQVTIVDKIKCLRHMFERFKSTTTDEAITNFVLLILGDRCRCVNNWVSNLVFLTQFRFSVTGDSYIVATLEAAIHYIRHNREVVVNSESSGSDGLIQAAVDNQTRIVEELLLRNVDVNSIDARTNKTALHFACQGGYQSLVLLLLSHGANCSMVDTDGNTPLHVCCIHGHDSCAKALIFDSVTPPLSVVNNDGDSPLDLALRYNYVTIVKILSECESAITRTLTTDNHYYNHLIGKFRPPIRSRHGTPAGDQGHVVTLLFKAIESGDLPLTRHYLGFATSNAVIGHSNCHPLCNCHKCRQQVSPIVPPNCNVLTKVNVCDGKGLTPLHVAAKLGRVDIVRILLDLGALPDLATYGTLRTALHLACIHCQFGAVRELLKCGDCDVDVRDCDGNTPLFYACVGNCVRIVEVLLGSGGSCEGLESEGFGGEVGELLDKSQREAHYF